MIVIALCSAIAAAAATSLVWLCYWPDATAVSATRTLPADYDAAALHALDLYREHEAACLHLQRLAVARSAELRGNVPAMPPSFAKAIATGRYPIPTTSSCAPLLWIAPQHDGYIEITKTVCKPRRRSSAAAVKVSPPIGRDSRGRFSSRWRVGPKAGR